MVLGGYCVWPVDMGKSLVLKQRRLCFDPEVQNETTRKSVLATSIIFVVPKKPDMDDR
jgi:hypothetical protein